MSIQDGMILTLTEAVGDFSFKQAVTNGSQQWRAFGHLSYLGLSQVLYTLLQRDKLAILNAYWDATSNVVTYAIGWLWFGETVTPTQHLGFVLTLVGSWLLREQ
jgi:multidrug transporter EmrE-like cation transporter